MSETFRKFEIYRRAFGPRGYWLALKTRLSPAPYEAVVHAPEGPIRLRLKTSDLNVYDKVFFNEDYDFEICREPEVIVDAGANLGFASIYFARKYPRARVFAIEPEGSNFKLLQQNVRPFKNITPIRGALWNEDGTMDLVDPGIGHWGYQIAGKGTTTDQPVVEKVPTFTMATLMRDHGIRAVDIFKVDIEGAEKELFENAASWIDSVGVIMIELHDRMKPGCSEAFSAAASGFPVEQAKGENIFRARAEFVTARVAGTQK